jgi:hypothetical protein
LVFDRVMQARQAGRDADRAAGGVRAALHRRRDTRSRTGSVAAASFAAFASQGSGSVPTAAEREITRTEHPPATSMPDVIGMGLRAATETIVSAGLQCRTKGSGRRVTQQDPPPGAELARVARCTLVY